MRVSSRVILLVLAVVLVLGCSFVVVMSGCSRSDNLPQERKTVSESWKNVSTTPFVILDSKSGSGSGCLVTYKGRTFILTAYHVYHMTGDKPMSVLNYKNEQIGYATKWLADKSRDIVLLLATAETYQQLPEPLPVSERDVSEYEGLIGRDVVYHGHVDVGEWLGIGRNIAAFTECTCLSRVHVADVDLSAEMDNKDSSCFNKKKTLMLTIKGAVWYGCSGGPLIMNGEVIGVCSCIENFSPKAGGVYINPLWSLQELFGE